MQHGLADALTILHAALHVPARIVAVAAGIHHDATLCPLPSQCFPRFCNSGLVGCQKVVTGKARPPQPYVALRVGNQRRGYTSIGDRSFVPKWEERFRVPVAISPRDIEFQVKVSGGLSAVGTPGISSEFLGLTAASQSCCCAALILACGWCGAGGLPVLEASGSKQGVCALNPKP